jgi:glycosyltransferase involved in cell wall biosynthesis
MKRGFIFLRDLLINIFFSYRYNILFVVENYNWVTDSEWLSVSDKLNQVSQIRSRTTSTHHGLRGKVIHFGSVGTFVTKSGCKKVHHSNKVILTWFHIVANDDRLKFVGDINKRVSFVHTASENTKEKLIKSGIDRPKLVLIPLGINLEKFKPADSKTKKEFARSLGIREGAVVIGSFQKDGNGWGIGDTPKLIKGPDIFCDVVEKLAQDYPIHVLLTGPARGYVKKRLSIANINYTHIYLKNFNDIVNYYQILDLYLICSREEGGPKALLESMACGVPVVSTMVGMAPEVIRSGLNGYLVRVDDKSDLLLKSKELLNNQDLRSTFALEGLLSVKMYDYDFVAKIFERLMYNKLIK